MGGRGDSWKWVWMGGREGGRSVGCGVWGGEVGEGWVGKGRVWKWMGCGCGVGVDRR